MTNETDLAKELAELVLTEPDGDCARCGEEIVLEILEDTPVVCCDCAQEIVLILAKEVYENGR